MQSARFLPGYLLSCVLFGGCSLAFSKGPDNLTLAEATQCSTTLVPPVIDTLIAGGLFSVAAVGAVHSKTSSWDGLNQAVAGAMGVTGAVAMLSAVYGYTSSGKCREVKAANLEGTDSSGPAGRGRRHYQPR